MRAIQLTSSADPNSSSSPTFPNRSRREGEQVFDIRAAGINYADTHQTEDSYLARQSCR